jgi:hypothetical protein
VQSNLFYFINNTVEIKFYILYNRTGILITLNHILKLMQRVSMKSIDWHMLHKISMKSRLVVNYGK